VKERCLRCRGFVYLTLQLWEDEREQVACLAFRSLDIRRSQTGMWRWNYKSIYFFLFLYVRYRKKMLQPKFWQFCTSCWSFRLIPYFMGEKREQISVRKESAIWRKKQKRRSNGASAATTEEYSSTTQTHSCSYDVCVNCKALLVVCSQRITKRLIRVYCYVRYYCSWCYEHSLTTRGYCANSYLV